MSVQAQAILANIVSQNYAKGIKNQPYDFSIKPIFRANIGNPASFIGPILLAPGGSSSTTVSSSDRATTTATKPMKGTSQASPHVAGMYAAVKAANPGGVSVADVTAWVVTTGSISVTYALPPPVNTQTYRRVRVP